MLPTARSDAQLLFIFQHSTDYTPYGQSAATTSYTINSLYEYTAVGGASPTYDDNSNLTNNGTYKFKYNYKNLITEVRLSSDNSLVAEYMYDAEGRRVEKDVGGTVERYIRSRTRENSTNAGPGKGARYDMSHVVCVFDGSDAWKQNYVWSEVDGVVALEQADILDYDTDSNTSETTRSYYHRNALGSVMEITDANQAVVVSYRYDPYGAVTITRNSTPQSTDPLGQHWAFTGRFYDEESELYYYRARFYDPATGRFVSRDPAGYSEGPSLFEYAGSDPVNGGDPSGMRFLPDGDIDEATAEADRLDANPGLVHKKIREIRERRSAELHRNWRRRNRAVRQQLVGLGWALMGGWNILLGGITGLDGVGEENDLIAEGDEILRQWGEEERATGLDTTSPPTHPTPRR